MISLFIIVDVVVVIIGDIAIAVSTSSETVEADISVNDR